MNKRTVKNLAILAGLVMALAFAPVEGALAMVRGITGPTFHLQAKADYILTPDGGSIFMWGYSNGNNPMQYPGPTLIVNEGDTVTVTLENELENRNVSIVFPGQTGVVATGGVAGYLTREAPDGGTVTYTFTADHPGTFQYFSGTDSRLQIEMGLVGALIVRPHTAGQAYDDASTAFNREVLFLETEMDPLVHELVETGRTNEIDWSTYFPVYWFLNGRAAPDTMAEANVPWLPNQPYNCMPVIHPGEVLLLRFVIAGRDMHPFHTHAEDFRVIAQDGMMLSSGPGMGPDLGYFDFTYTGPAGSTADALFTWTGAKLGWDIYGHAPGDPMEPGEYAPDHGKPFPVMYPYDADLANGDFWSGSPFLGSFGYLPPGQGLDNLHGGFFYMWHSHKEKEMVNDDIFPGGMMTMLLIEHPDVMIME